MFIPIEGIRPRKTVKELKDIWQRAGGLRLEITDTFKTARAKWLDNQTLFPLELSGDELTVRLGPDCFGQNMELDGTITHVILSVAHSTHEDVLHPTVFTQTSLWTVEKPDMAAKTAVVEFGTWDCPPVVRFPSVAFREYIRGPRYGLIGEKGNSKKLIGFCIPTEIRNREMEQEDPQTIHNYYLEMLMDTVNPALNILEQPVHSAKLAASQADRRPSFRRRKKLSGMSFET